jgi:ribosomal protein L44E
MNDLRAPSGALFVAWSRFACRLRAVSPRSLAALRQRYIHFAWQFCERDQKKNLVRDNRQISLETRVAGHEGLGNRARHLHVQKRLPAKKYTLQWDASECKPTRRGKRLPTSTITCAENPARDGDKISLEARTWSQ